MGCKSGSSYAGMNRIKFAGLVIHLSAITAHPGQGGVYATWQRPLDTWLVTPDFGYACASFRGRCVNIKKIVIAGSMAAIACAAQGFQIISLSPQGEVARVRQVVVKFDESAVNFGDPKAAAPLSLSCSDAQATKGAGRWISDKEWAFEFERDLPPGIACELQVRPGIKSARGADLTGATSF